jgi:preprotein translocase subunit YajC
LYFLIWRPQSKRNQEHKDLIDNLSNGDEILTSGGILGKIIKVDKNFLILEISNNINIRIQKQSIIKAYPKGTMSSV